jgi:hypothetical protein
MSSVELFAVGMAYGILIGAIIHGVIFPWLAAFLARRGWR